MLSPAPGREQSHALVHAVGGDQTENSSAEAALVILIGTKLTMSQQHILEAKKAIRLLGCVRKTVASRSRELINFGLPSGRETWT